MVEVEHTESVWSIAGPCVLPLLREEAGTSLSASALTHFRYAKRLCSEDIRMLPSGTADEYFYSKDSSEKRSSPRREWLRICLAVI